MHLRHAALLIALALPSEAPRTAHADAPPPPGMPELVVSYTVHAPDPNHAPPQDRALDISVRDGVGAWSAGGPRHPLSDARLADVRMALRRFEEAVREAPPRAAEPCAFPAIAAHHLVLPRQEFAWETPCQKGKPAAVDGLLATLAALTALPLSDAYRIWFPPSPAGDYVYFTPDPTHPGEPQAMVLSRIRIQRSADGAGWSATYSSGEASAELSYVRAEIASFRADPIAVKTAWPGYLPRSFEGLFVEHFPTANEKGPVEQGLLLAGGEFFVRTR